MTELEVVREELTQVKAKLEEALTSNHRLSNQLMQQTTRYQEQMRPHLRNAWMKGHNAGWWNGRESMEADMSTAQVRIEALARGLADCPYIKDPKELGEVAAQYQVLGVGNGDD